MRAAFSELQSLPKRAAVAAALAIVIGGGAVGLLGTVGPALGSTCGAFQCATFTVGLGGDGAGAPPRGAPPGAPPRPIGCPPARGAHPRAAGRARARAPV